MSTLYWVAARLIGSSEEYKLVRYSAPGRCVNGMPEVILSVNSYALEVKVADQAETKLREKGYETVRIRTPNQPFADVLNLDQILFVDITLQHIAQCGSDEEKKKYADLSQVLPDHLNESSNGTSEGRRIP